MIQRYTLIGKLPVPCRDLLEWGFWLETADRHVARTNVGCLWVSTVFLGLDHSFGSGEPLLFETIVFNGDEVESQDRCSTWDEAERHHAEAVAEAERRMAAIGGVAGWEGRPPPST